MVSANPAVLTHPRQRSLASRLFEVHEGLVSRSSVLWLSGVLIGMTLSGGLISAADLYCFEFGIFGLLAYITFEIAAQRRLRRQWDEQNDRLAQRQPLSAEPGYARTRHQRS